MSRVSCSRRVWARFMVLLLLVGIALAAFGNSAVGQQNSIQVENGRRGTTAWQLFNPATNGEVEGYASTTSVNRGHRIIFFVRTTSPTFTIAIYRLRMVRRIG